MAAGASPSDALAAAAARTVFTTHTPVPAGNDTYPAEQVEAAIAGLAGELGMRRVGADPAWAARTPTTRTSRSASRSWRCA